MFFRTWYHTCQLYILAMLAGMAGMWFNIPLLFSAVVSFVVPAGLFGAALGVLSLTVGLRTACPICGRKSPWIVARRFIGIDCESCGIYGGYPLAHIVPFKVEDADCENVDDPQLDPFRDLKK